MVAVAALFSGVTATPAARNGSRLYHAATPRVSKNHIFITPGTCHFMREKTSFGSVPNKTLLLPRNVPSPRCSGSSDQPSAQDKTPFGYTRKDVLLIGVGLTVFGIGLKSGLEYVGVDPLQAGNVVQLVLVLGLTVGWISTYIFRVSNKEMTYAQQLRDYEDKVMQKRLESLTEAEIEALLEQVEEEKRRLAGGEQQQQLE